MVSTIISIIEIIAVIILTTLIIIILRDRKRLILRRIVGVLVINLLIIGHFSYANMIEKPILGINKEETLVLEYGTEYIEYGAKATYHNEDISNHIQIENQVNMKQIGDYIVTYKLPFREKEIVKTRTVKVIDTQSPVITLKGKQDVNVPSNSKFAEEGYIATDNADGDITDKVIVGKETVDDKTYKIIYTVEDQSGNQASVSRTIHIVAPIVTENPNKTGVIYLTFDDGPSLDITPKILDILKEENVKATFFILNYDKNREVLVKRIIEEGHTIGIHGYSHEYKDVYASVDSFMNNVTSLQEKIYNSTGVKTIYTRFPGGSSNTVSKKYTPGIMSILTKKLVNEGYKYYDWNVSSGDAGGAKTKEEVYHNVTSGLKKNKANMVLMHDYAKNDKTLDALRSIIQYGKQNGYTFEKIGPDAPMITQKVAN